MNRREVLSTDTVLPGRRVEFWNDAACESLTQQVAEPLNPRTFSGRMIRADVGNLRFVELNSDAAVVRHSRAHIARSSGAYFLIPYQLAFNVPVSILTLRVAKNILQRYVGSPENLVHIPVSGTTGAGALASRV